MSKSRRDGSRAAKLPLAITFPTSNVKIARFLYFLTTVAIICSSLEILLPSKARGQIIPDTSLGAESSIVTPANINGIDSDRIDGGAIRGSNLFHSFEQFNIRDGGAAYFSNPAAISNILTRVTGSNPSNIFGTLGVLGNANLFLLNPNGIVFGANARLDMRGSFVGSSANSLIFENGFEFSAANPQAPPLLTINIPIGLNFRDFPSSIVVEGPGNNLREEDFVPIRDDRPAGLQVPLGQTLALVGGEVTLSGGNLTAESGRVELWSVAEGSLQLTANNGQLAVDNPQATTSFGDIRLEGAASIDTSGNGGGNVRLQGRNIQLTDGSAILANTAGSARGGSTIVRASESVELVGTSANGEFPSRLLALVELGATRTSTGGDLLIEAERVTMREGGQVQNTTFGAGDSGTLTIRATEVEAIGESANGFFGSGVFGNADVDATGSAGGLIVETSHLTLSNGAQIAAATFGAGDAGKISVQATEVELIGRSPSAPVDFGSGLFASVEEGATGSGGSLEISTERLSVRDGAQIATVTKGDGNAGTVSLQATEVELIGGFFDPPEDVDDRASGISATVDRVRGEDPATGMGGNLTMETSRLTVRDGAQIQSATFGEGNGGMVTLRAAEIELIGTSADGNASSGLFASVQPGGTGNGGSLIIESDRLTVRDGARITVGTLGEGDGGTLTVGVTDTISIGGTSPASGLPSQLSAGVGPGGTGQGRDLTIETSRIIVRNGGQINTGTLSLDEEATAGNISIQASDSVELIGSTPVVDPEILARDFFIADDSGQFPSGIFASSAAPGVAEAGTINLQTGQLSVRDGARVSASSQVAGAAGNVAISATELLLDGGSLRAETVEGNQANIVLSVRDLQMRRGSEITTNARGQATGGNITINSQTLVALEDSDISANAQRSSGGRVIINTEGIFGTQFRQQDTSQSDITATSDLGAEFSGTVEVNTPESDPSSGLVELSANVVDAASIIGQDPCAQARTSEFVRTGRGGLPPNPNQRLNGNMARIGWVEPVSPGESGRATSQESLHGAKLPLGDRVVPARGWVFQENGEVVLVSYDPTNKMPQRETIDPSGCASK